MVRDSLGTAIICFELHQQADVRTLLVGWERDGGMHFKRWWHETGTECLVPRYFCSLYLILVCFSFLSDLTMFSRFASRLSSSAFKRSFSTSTASSTASKRSVVYAVSGAAGLGLAAYSVCTFFFLCVHHSPNKCRRFSTTLPLLCLL